MLAKTKKRKKKPEIVLVNTRRIAMRDRHFDHDAVLYTYMVDGVMVRGVHWSGRFDGPVEELAKKLYELAVATNASYVTTTESQQDDSREVVKARFGAGWGVQKTREYLCIFNRDEFEPIKRKTKIRRKLKTKVARTKTLTFVRQWAFWRQMHRGNFHLRHTALKHRWKIMPIHGPSSIQNGNRWKGGNATKVAKAGYPKHGRNVARFAKRHPDAVQVTPFDVNFHLGVEWFQDWVEDATRSASVWRAASHLPDKGTHGGGRTIDGAVIHGAVLPDRKAA